MTFGMASAYHSGIEWLRQITERPHPGNLAENLADDSVQALSDALASKLDQNSRSIIVNNGSSSKSDRLTYCVFLGIGGVTVWYAFKTQLVTKATLVDTMRKVKETIKDLADGILNFQSVMTNKVDGVKAELNEVSNIVQCVKTDTACIRDVTERCEAALQENSDRLQFATAGIHLLCGVVAESNLASSRSKKKLTALLKNSSRLLPPNQKYALQQAPARRKCKAIETRSDSFSCHSASSRNGISEYASDATDDSDCQKDSVKRDHGSISTESMALKAHQNSAYATAYLSSSSLSECEPPPRHIY